MVPTFCSDTAGTLKHNRFYESPDYFRPRTSIRCLIDGNSIPATERIRKSESKLDRREIKGTRYRLSHLQGSIQMSDTPAFPNLFDWKMSPQ